jgi:O-antigen/teichoic acid export membrane protein
LLGKPNPAAMTFRKNIISSYASQTYTSALGILIVPLYLRFIGSEAYGLIGFFAMLQTWFQLLDFGLSGTMSREVARLQGGVSDRNTLRQLLRCLEGIFIFAGIAGVSLIIFASSPISTKWLQVEHIPLREVRDSIRLMALIVGLRWVAGLYRGVITGFERITWLSSTNSIIATARFLLVIPLFLLFGDDITLFFKYQLVLAVCEILALIWKTYSLLPSAPKERTQWNLAPLKTLVKFSCALAFTTSVWVMVTQTDKLLLSKLLPLSQYASFSVAVLAAGGITLLSGPISIPLLPRLTRLNAANEDSEFVSLYRKSTRLICAIVIPPALVLIFFPREVLFAWTGKLAISQEAFNALRFYSIGNAVLAISAFAYYLQYSKGNLRLHLFGSALFLIILIPLLLFLTKRCGVSGAGYAWAIVNILYFSVWVPWVHRTFLRGIHMKWLVGDVGTTVALPTCVAFAAHSILSHQPGRLEQGITVGVVGFCLLVGSLSYYYFSESLRSRMNRRQHSDGAPNRFPLFTT